MQQKLEVHAYFCNAELGLILQVYNKKLYILTYKYNFTFLYIILQCMYNITVLHALLFIISKKKL